MLKRTVLVLLMLFILFAGYANAESVLKSSLSSSTHSKNTWSNNNKITMTWTKPSADATYGAVKGYAIKWDTSSSTNPGTALSLDANATSTTSGALSDGQNIYFHIRVIYENGSPFEWDDFGPFWIDTTAPSKPSDFTITTGDTTLTLGWKNPGETDFAGVVIRSSTKTGDTCNYPSSATAGSAVATITKDASPNNAYTHTGLANGTTYCYSIFAYDQRGTEATRNYSSPAQANGTPVSSGTTTPPKVTSTDPTTNATDVPITTTVTIGFSKDMNSSTIADASGNSSTITVKDASNNVVSGTFTYTASSKSVKFTPSSNLAYNTKYTVTVLGGTSGVKDSQGNTFDGNGDGTASTSGDNFSYNFTTAQATPPDVSSIVPSDGSTNIALNQVITVTFTKDMNSNSINTTTFKVTVGSTAGTAVSGTISYNALDKTATFTPSANYTGGAKIYIVLVGGDNGMKDTNGVAMKNSSYTYSFTVIDTPIINLSSTSINFGAAVANQDTKDQTLTVKNIGKANLILGQSTVASTTHFNVKQDGCNGQSLAQDASCNIVVQFKPTATGTLSTNLLIPSNSGRTDTQTSTTTTVPLTGSGDNIAALTLSKTSIDFGTVNVDASSSVTITVTSSGTRDLVIDGFSFAKGNVGFSVPDSTNTCKGKTIAVNSTCTFVVVFAPTSEAQSITDVLTITSNNGRTDTTTSSNSTVNLYGTAQKAAYNLSLSAGWNLISLPYQPTNTAIATVLNAISGKYTIVWAYINGWKVYDPSDVEGSTLTNFIPGYGYWIKATEATTWSVP